MSSRVQSFEEFTRSSNEITETEEIEMSEVEASEIETEESAVGESSSRMIGARRLSVEASRAVVEKVYEWEAARKITNAGEIIAYLMGFDDDEVVLSYLSSDPRQVEQEAMNFFQDANEEM
jgi:hypothetical protein